MLNEKLLYIIWQFKIFTKYPLATISGKPLEIIYSGDLNSDAGPDFINARIIIDGIQLAGNIEIHQKTSDFLKHAHHQDKNYHSLILHIVYEHDVDIQMPHHVEVLELKNYISNDVIQQYHSLINFKQVPSCINMWDTLDEFYIQHWLQRMLVEKLEIKYQQIQKYFDKTKDYQETFYRLFCRHLGFKINNDAFEKLAEILPLKILLRHSDNLSILEALIYGTAGFLDKAYNDKYLMYLQNEFEFLRKKYQIESIDSHIWKFARMRPANFPSLRLHQLALMIHQVPEMFHNPSEFFLQKKNIEKLHVVPQNYFSTHLTFDEDKITDKVYHFGDMSLQLIWINVIVPYLFFYGKSTGEEVFQSLALDYLEKIPAENNMIIRKFAAQKKFIRTAIESQGILHLYPEYCVQKRCADCNIGIKILGRNSGSGMR